MASEIRVNQIQNRSGLGTVTFSDSGVSIAGVTTVGILSATGNSVFSGSVTATTFSGALTGNVTGNATGLSGTPNITVGTIGATSLNASGVITATSFSGSGANVSGVSTLGNTVVGGGTTQLVVTGNARITGILTIGTGSITLDGSNNQLKVGTGVTITTNGIVGVTSINSGQLGGSRNVIINGAMVVNQRGFTGSSGATASLAYTTDRFRIDHSHDGAVSAGQTTMNSTVGGNAYADGFNSALHYRVTTADASLAAGQYAIIQQLIEGFNLQGFKKGTANAQQFTLSFWVRSSLTGTYIAELYDVDNTRQVSKSYTIDTANTWEKKTLTYPADTTGVFDNDNGLSLGLNWWLAAGSTYSGGTLNTSWATITNANRTVGQVNFLATAGNNFFLTGVQLEVGPTATEFERRSFGDELRLCQRYYQVLTITGNSYLAQYSNNANFYGQPVTLPVQMRVASTSTTYVNVSGANYWVEPGIAAYSANSTTGINFVVTPNSVAMTQSRQAGGATPTRNYPYTWEPSFQILLSSEL